MTRGTPQDDVGFMSSPERLNVLLSRARQGLIIIGNSKTFENSRKRVGIWSHFFCLIQNGKHSFDGLHVKCEKHPDRTSVLRCVEDFDKLTPNSGWRLCGTMVSFLSLTLTGQFDPVVKKHYGAALRRSRFPFKMSFAPRSQRNTMRIPGDVEMQQWSSNISALPRVPVTV